MSDKDKLAKLIIRADDAGMKFKNDKAAERFERAVKKAKTK